VLCDACRKGTHTFCMRPKLTEVPPDNYYCQKCAQHRALDTNKEDDAWGRALLGTGVVWGGRPGAPACLGFGLGALQRCRCWRLAWYSALSLLCCIGTSPIAMEQPLACCACLALRCASASAWVMQSHTARAVQQGPRWLGQAINKARSEGGAGACADRVTADTPRLLINRERAGEADPYLRLTGYNRGFNFDEGNYRCVGTWEGV
jgi:hypothetical protein